MARILDFSGLYRWPCHLAKRHSGRIAGTGFNPASGPSTHGSFGMDGPAPCNGPRCWPPWALDMAFIHDASQQGVAPLSRALGQIRGHLQSLPAFAPYMAGCQRAAITENGAVLFVHGGVDPARPLSLQTDAFWWGHPDFFRLTQPYADFKNGLFHPCPRGAGSGFGPRAFGGRRRGRARRIVALIFN